MSKISLFYGGGEIDLLGEWITEKRDKLSYIKEKYVDLRIKANIDYVGYGAIRLLVVLFGELGGLETATMELFDTVGYPYNIPGPRTWSDRNIWRLKYDETTKDMFDWAREYLETKPEIKVKKRLGQGIDVSQYKSYSN